MYRETQTIERKSFSVPEFAKRHGISTATVWRRIAAGEITAFKTGGLTRILIDEEARWLDALSNASKQPARAQ